MLRLRTTATLSVLFLAGAVGMAWWMSSWPRMHDRATEAAVAARVRAQQHKKPSRPPAHRQQRASRHAVIQSAAANPPSPPPPPAPVYAPSPAYPMEALRKQRGGVVTLRVSVDAHGSVTGVSVANSSGDPKLDASARETMQQWRFQAPADGEPATFDYPVTFRIGRVTRE